VRALDKAAEDERVRGLLLNLGSREALGGMAMVQVRRAAGWCEQCKEGGGGRLGGDGQKEAVRGTKQDLMQMFCTLVTAICAVPASKRGFTPFSLQGTSCLLCA